jgi:hypothetical protein
MPMSVRIFRIGVRSEWQGGNKKGKKDKKGKKSLKFCFFVPFAFFASLRIPLQEVDSVNVSRHQRAI